MRQMIPVVPATGDKQCSHVSTENGRCNGYRVFGERYCAYHRYTVLRAEGAWENYDLVTTTDYLESGGSLVGHDELSAALQYAFQVEFGVIGEEIET